MVILIQLLLLICFSYIYYKNINNEEKKISAPMHMLICNFVISPTPQMLVYFLANPIYCSKQQRSISECANVHADPYLCYKPNSTDVQACLFLS